MYTDSYNVSLTLDEKCMRYRNLLAYLPFERCSEISSRGDVMNDTRVFKRDIQTHCFNRNNLDCLKLTFKFMENFIRNFFTRHFYV